MSTDDDVEVVFAVLRTDADESGYGGWISDERLQTLAQRIVEALAEHTREPPPDTADRKKGEK